VTGTLILASDGLSAARRLRDSGVRSLAFITLNVFVVESRTMHAMITRLSFTNAEAADAEMEDLSARIREIAAAEGFHAVYGVRTGRTEIVIVRVFDSAQGAGRSLGPLRPDLAAQFASPPLRMSGEVMAARTAVDE
jgi:hypothetical protein